MDFIYIWCTFFVNYSYEELFWSFVYFIGYCVGAGITTLISLSNGLDPYTFQPKDEKDAVYEGRDG